MRDVIRPGSAEHAALVRELTARIERLRTELEQPRDQPTTDRLRGRIIELRSLFATLTDRPEMQEGPA